MKKNLQYNLKNSSLKWLKIIIWKRYFNYPNAFQKKIETHQNHHQTENMFAWLKWNKFKLQICLSKVFFLNIFLMTSCILPFIN